MRRQKYQLVGEHGAVKKCRWLHKGLREGKGCYKQRFYGIESHRCIQMTPTISCTLRCLFCWRTHPEDLDYGGEKVVREWTEAERLVEETIKAQRRILSGYRSQVLEGRIPEEQYREALSPRHAAISLDGEPTLYPHISSLIWEFKRRGFTTFLVTNGTRPHILSSLEVEPSQLYLSLYALSPTTFTRICRPPVGGLWEQVMEVIRLLPSFNCPTVLRLTLVKGLNMGDPGGYAQIVEEASPTYIEAKAYMYVGASRRRLRFENMPSHLEVQEFSKKLAASTGYLVVEEATDSRVVLLSKSKKISRLR